MAENLDDRHPLSETLPAPQPQRIRLQRGFQQLLCEAEQLLPARQCRNCRGRTRSRNLCPECWQQLTLDEPRCYQCALPLIAKTAASPRLCGECLSNPPAFTRSVTGSGYQEPFNRWINNFKRRRDLRDGHLLSQLLERQVNAHYHNQSLPQLLIPVPLHWSRLLVRSFNQSAWLVHQLHKSMNISALDALNRNSTGRAQKQLNRRQRQLNLKHAFSIKESARDSIVGKHLALVDDVVTTSATARVISKLLIDAGASRIDIWSLARTDKTGFHH